MEERTRSQALMAKIQALPAEQMAEVENFIDFIAGKPKERARRL